MKPFDDFAADIQNELLVNEPYEDALSHLAASINNRTVTVTLKILKEYHNEYFKD